MQKSDAFQSVFFHQTAINLQHPVKDDRELGRICVLLPPRHVLRDFNCCDFDARFAVRVHNTVETQVLELDTNRPGKVARYGEGTGPKLFSI